MPIDNEQMVHGWRNLAEFLGMSESKVKRLRPELKACGAVFYGRFGRARRKTLCFFPSEIKKWCRIKGAKGEMI